MEHEKLPVVPPGLGLIIPLTVNTTVFICVFVVIKFLNII